MAPFMRDFLWMAKLMVMEDLYHIINKKYMSESGIAITSKDMVNRNAKNLKCVTLVNSIIIGFMVEERSCTKMDRLSPGFTLMESGQPSTLLLSITLN